MIISQLRGLKSLGFLGIIYLIIAIIAGFTATIFIMISIENMLIDDDMICYMTGGFSGFSFIAMTVEVALIVFAALKLIEHAIVHLISRKKEKHLSESEIGFSDKERQLENQESEKTSLAKGVGAIAVLLAIFVAFNALLVYFMSTDMTVVNRDGIIEKSIINPVGKAYSFDDIESYELSDDDCNNPIIVLSLSNGKSITIGPSENTSGFGDAFEDEYDYLIYLDQILKDCSAEKTVTCTPEDFDYYEQDKEKLDILMER